MKKCWWRKRFSCPTLLRFSHSPSPACRRPHTSRLLPSSACALVRTLAHADLLDAGGALRPLLACSALKAVYGVRPSFPAFQIVICTSGMAGRQVYGVRGGRDDILRPILWSVFALVDRSLARWASLEVSMHFCYKKNTTLHHTRPEFLADFAARPGIRVFVGKDTRQYAPLSMPCVGPSPAGHWGQVRQYKGVAVHLYKILVWDP